MSSIDSNPAIMKNEDDIVPLAVFMVLDNIEGPVLLGVDPEIDRLDFKSTIEFSGLRVFSSIEPLDLMQSGYLHALYPWSNPKGQLACLYFSLETSDLSFDLTSMENPAFVFLVGVLIDRHFSQVVRWIPDAINNVLEETASSIAESLAIKRWQNGNKNAVQELEMALKHQHEELIQSRLREMRKKMISLVLEWLHQFE